MNRPSGLQATPVTEASCPRMVNCSRPVAVFQTFTV